MMRALFSAVSGLKAHQTSMDVISNNISNVNTVGYKAQRVTFSDILSQTLSSATGADSTTGRGGSNAKQVGLGAKVASIDSLMTTGSTESTGNSTDLSISGSGFFIVRNGTTGSYMFTRDGNFSIDENGNLVTSDGMNVYGWEEYTKSSDGDYVFNTDAQVAPINIYSDSVNGNKKILAAKATENAVFTGSLDSSEDAICSSSSQVASASGLISSAQYTTTMTVYDSLGNSHELTVDFTKCYVDNSASGATNPPVTTWYYSIKGDSGSTVSGATGYIKFDSKGKIDTEADGISGITYSTTPTISLTPDTGAAALSVKLDFSDLTSTSEDSSVETSDVDGYPSGTLSDISIDSNGIITGTYSNSKTQALGKIALAQFDNAAGLEREGSNYYVTTANSGDFTNGVSAGGTISSGTLEMSNVDLSTEFANMIVTQRGFQANSRIITAADEMLQTLIDMKR